MYQNTDVLDVASETSSFSCATDVEVTSLAETISRNKRKVKSRVDTPTSKINSQSHINEFPRIKSAIDSKNSSAKVANALTMKCDSSCNSEAAKLKRRASTITAYSNSGVKSPYFRGSPVDSIQNQELSRTFSRTENFPLESFQNPNINIEKVDDEVDEIDSKSLWLPTPHVALLPIKLFNSRCQDLNFIWSCCVNLYRWEQ